MQSKKNYTLDIRASNDGVAFRWIIPADDRPNVPDEATTFVIPEGSAVWYHGLRGHYEDVHTRKQIAEIPSGQWAAPPLTFKLPGGAGYASITEAALAHYSGMALKADGRRGFTLVLGHAHPASYPFELRYKEDVQRLSQPAALRGTITTPWRVVMIGRDLNALVNSDLVHNLCPLADPKLFPEGMRTSWSAPGRAVWKYLDGGQNSFQEMKEFSRMAGELGFEYHVIEGFWSRWSDKQLKELVDYSRQRGVGLWLWKHSKQLRTPQEREAFFREAPRFRRGGGENRLLRPRTSGSGRPLCRPAGRSRQVPCPHQLPWRQQAHRRAADLAQRTGARGRARHGVEPIDPARAPRRHASLHAVPRRSRRLHARAFRCAPGRYHLDAPDRHGCRVHRALLTYAAHPANLLKSPGVEMIKSIPASWDETIVLPVSEIGEVAAFARRSGDAWFLAVVNGPDARTLNLPLAFLAEGDYQGLIVRDAKDEPAALALQRRSARRGDSWAIDLSPGGGFVARFSKAGKPSPKAPSP